MTIETFYAEGFPKVDGYFYQGVAVKSSDLTVQN